MFRLLEGVVPYKSDDEELYINRGWWRGFTLGDYLDLAANIHSDKEAFIDRTSRYTYGEAREKADRLAVAMINLGIQPLAFALVVLAIGAVLAGFVGIPAALGGGNAIEHFLHPSFAPPSSAVASTDSHSAPATEGRPVITGTEAGATTTEMPHISHAAELALMGFSLLIAIIGIATAYRFYVRKPEIAERLKARLSGPHRVLYNKYYVDELYGATVIDGTMASANGLWTFDRNVVDGAVNGSGWLTIFSSWISSLLDKYIVDGLVNLVGSVLQESSFVFRRLQTGLIQNYALLMLFGVFAFVSIYLLVR